jgi:hypothetical protein
MRGKSGLLTYGVSMKALIAKSILFIGLFALVTPLHAFETPSGLDANQVNRFFRGLDGVSLGLDLRIGQAESDGSASDEAQAIEAVAYACEHEFSEVEATRTDSLKGDNCPIKLERKLELTAATEESLKVKISRNIQLNNDKLADYMTLKSESSTTEVDITENEKIGVYRTKESHTVETTTAGTVNVNRTMSVLQNYEKFVSTTVVTAEVTGGIQLNTTVLLTVNQAAESAELSCTLSQKPADCAVVLFLLGLADNPSGESPVAIDQNLENLKNKIMRFTY